MRTRSSSHPQCIPFLNLLVHNVYLSEPPWPRCIPFRTSLHKLYSLYIKHTFQNLFHNTFRTSFSQCILFRTSLSLMYTFQNLLIHNVYLSEPPFHMYTFQNLLVHNVYCILYIPFITFSAFQNLLVHNVYCILNIPFITFSTVVSEPPFHNS